MTVKRSMPPVGASDAVLLILGSLPGEASLAVQRYYAHPQNQFWRLLGGAIGEPLADIDYAARLELLEQRGVALRDAVSEATRTGSLDGAIRSALTNPLAEFVAGHPHLRAVAFNGKTASRLGRAELAGTGMSLIDLPSSSPAYTLPLVSKAVRWAVLGPLALAHETATLGR